MSRPDMLPLELMQLVADFMESEGIVYRVVGSMASTVYGEPRFTNDVDILADLSQANVTALVAAFPAPDFYVSEPAVREAIGLRHQFNILHIPSGLKVDVILPADAPFSRSELSRGRRLGNEGEFSAWFSSPEDVILKKLVYFQLGGSEKHLRDIAGMLKLQGDRIDRAYLAHWAGELGVVAEWQLVLHRMDQDAT